METLCFNELHTFGNPPLWEFDAIDISGINLNSQYALDGVESISRHLPLVEPLIFTTPTFDISSPSSSRLLSPVRSATSTHLSPCSSVDSKKRGAADISNHPKIESFRLPKRQRTREKQWQNPPHVDFRSIYTYKPDTNAVAQLKEMIYRAAVMRPVNLGPESAADKPKRRNVKVSNDPQTTAARHRRERLSEKLRVLQRLVPGGTKMDTATMLDEAANYLIYLKKQISAMERSSCSNSKTRSLFDFYPKRERNFQ